MVKVVYNTGRRISVDPNISVGKAIEMVASTAPSLEHCVIFNDQRLDNETVISQIPGINEHHTLRVICVNQKPKADLSKDTPSLADMIHCYDEQMTDHDLQKYADCVEHADFKKKLLKKFPSLVQDENVLGIVSDRVLTVELLKKENNEQFFEDHPLFLPALYMTLELAFNQDVLNRLLSKTPRVESNDQYSRADLNRMLSFLPTPAPRAQPTPGQPLFTNEMFANALNAIGQQPFPAPALTANTPSSSGISASAPASIARIEDPMQTYATQLAQLHEYGFTNDVENVFALQASSGNIELALEIVLRNREEEMDLD